jgi:glycosyltransferase involved in cell wall biosynthesis
LRNADSISQKAAVGVVIVDDTDDLTAQPVAEKFRTTFELGLHYVSAASGNISVARNMGLEDASLRGEWIAMTDDDCEPEDTWLACLLDVQARTAADVVTGLMLRRPSVPAANWLIDQGFLKLGEFAPADGEDLQVAFTNNCLISSRCVRHYRDLRFDDRLGRIGGEDMVFFGQARAKGMRICFSKEAIVYENEPAERLTYQYQLWRYYWHGNSSVVTQTRNGVRRSRMFIHGCMSLVRAISYSPRRLICSQKPHFRYSLALIGEAVGKLFGSLGIKVNHH